MSRQTVNLFKRTGFDNPNGGSLFRDCDIKREAGKGKGKEASIVVSFRVKSTPTT